MLKETENRRKTSEDHYDALRKADPAFDKYIKKLLVKERGMDGQTLNEGKTPKRKSKMKKPADTNRKTGKNLIKSPSEVTLYMPALKHLVVKSPQFMENSVLNRLTLNETGHDQISPVAQDIAVLSQNRSKELVEMNVPSYMVDSSGNVINELDYGRKDRANNLEVVQEITNQISNSLKVLDFRVQPTRQKGQQLYTNTRTSKG